MICNVEKREKGISIRGSEIEIARLQCVGVCVCVCWWEPSERERDREREKESDPVGVDEEK